MAAASAYAALVSLMNVLTRYQHPTCPVSFDQSQIQTLLDKVTSLVDFLEIYYYDSQTTTATSTGSIQGLERKMIGAAHAAEDLIESSYVNRLLKRDGLELCPDLQNSIQEMDQIIHESTNVRVKRHKRDPQEKNGSKLEHSSSASRPRDKNIMVGFDEHLNCLNNRIRTHNSNREIIPIVGMGGIGKTTLARNVYDNPNICRLFDVRAWVTISQNYVVEDIILRLLDAINVTGNKQDEPEDRLYKGLCSRKYLIVLDDVWSSQLWSEIRRLFPDNGNKSRILLTTRLWSVANTVGSSSPYQLPLLDDDKSFDLLSKTIYGGMVFPPDLETFGKAIAISCKGLPLAIVVIGGFLKVSPETPMYWASVAQNIGSIISTEMDGHCLDILWLSYNHLPIHLKPCFLYMATFKENEQIEIPCLINLWVADGFLRPRKDRNLEEVALDYLNDLIGRNLIMAGVKNEIGKLRRCSVHDLLREFCLREAQNENFLCLIEEEDTLNLPQRLETERRLVYNSSNYKSHSLFPPVPNARSVYFGSSENLVELTTNPVLSLLRVLRISRGFKMPLDFVPLFNLRHLECRSPNSLSLVQDSLLSLSLFWNLETLILIDPACYDRIINLPCEIWGFPNLRHLEVLFAAVIPDPGSGETNCVLNNLQTISTCGNFYYTDEALKLIPNLKELIFVYDTSVRVVEDHKLSRSFTNLALLDKLEKLAFGFSPMEGVKLTFSPNLRELTLQGCGIPWDNLTIIGSLPNLELLDLKSHAFCGEVWNSIEGEFMRLKYLSIIECDLGIWRADSCHFPRLENLKFFNLRLKEIPQGIGEVSSLESIEFCTTQMSLVISAKEILEERRNQGDVDLLIKGLYWGNWNEEDEKLKKWAEAEYNFQIQFYGMTW